MARFSLGGDEDNNAEDLNRRHSSKRIRTAGPSTTPVINTVQSPSETEQGSEEENERDSAHYSSYNREKSVEREQFVEEEEQSSGIGSGRDPEGAISLTLEDPDVLDCPICLEPLAPPVYQCENGHIACSSCCPIMRNKCGTCCLPIGYNRCRAMEKVLESVKIPCKNIRYGCDRTIRYSEKLGHEQTCKYTPCFCPLLDCAYINNSKCLRTHFATKHPSLSKSFCFDSPFPVFLDDGQKCVFLQDMNDPVLFILRRSIEPLGSFVSVVCVEPTSSRRRFSYKLTAKLGATSVILKSDAENVPEWNESKSSKKSLLVRSDFLDVFERLWLKLVIRKNPVVRHFTGVLSGGVDDTFLI